MKSRYMHSVLLKPSSVDRGTKRWTWTFGCLVNDFFIALELLSEFYARQIFELVTS